ncbi:MAG TPA: hypothetical protein VGV92_09055 [Gammaproteobacteria bacterium]|nr:hypothetical protein [Gammaproteobacteria bacterium]
MKEAARGLSAVLKRTAEKLGTQTLNGPVKAGSTNVPEMFKVKPLPPEAIQEMGKQLEEYTEKKKDFGAW